MAKNSDYWAKRAVENENNARTTAQIGKNELEKIFTATSLKLQKEIEYWWYRFAKNNNLTVAEAKKLMTKKELDELNWDVEEYIRKGIEAAITQIPYIEKQLENASAKFHISRLNALKIQVLSICNELFADTNKTVKESMKKVYEDTYYKTAYNIQTGVGVYSNFSKIDEDLLEKIISKPWADDGSNFSERIWGKYRPQLVNRIHKDLIDCVSRGRNPNEYSEALAKDFKVSLKQAGDLMLSEYNYFNEQATQDCLNKLDVEEYEILGTLDGVTCATCGGLDGKHYPLKDAVIGVNSPPFHPRCRCTTIPYFDDEFTENEERAYRGEDGKTHYTKAKTYEEWKKEFVKEKGQDAWDLYEKGSKYRNSDNEQYQNYKEVLGKNAPESLEEFQKIKYTDKEEWDSLKTILKDKKLQEEIRESYNLNIHEGSQGKHILDHNNYIEGRSYLTISMEEAQKLVDKYAGTGKMLRTVNGDWRKQEIIKSSDKIVGVVINNLTGECYETSFFKIHYSKNKGVHIVPYREDITL